MMKRLEGARWQRGAAQDASAKPTAAGVTSCTASPAPMDVQSVSHDESAMNLLVSAGSALCRLGIR